MKKLSKKRITSFQDIWFKIDTEQRLKRTNNAKYCEKKIYTRLIMMNNFIIKTNKGYICERKDYDVYTKKINNVNEFYSRGFGGAFFNMQNSNNDGVDKLGFTEKIEEAQVFSSCIGNRIQEIIDRINWGYEDITEIEIILKKGEDEVC